jgi:bifunctional polynucleotide phosphatase/kinase
MKFNIIINIINNTYMPPIIYKINNPVMTNMIAAFDYDHTLVKPKDGRQFPKDVNDWMWLYPNIPRKIKRYYSKGYTIVIFTNQTKEWKCDQIKNVMETLDIPIIVCIAMNKIEHKPNTIMFDSIIDKNDIDMDDSFFVGDALGRKNDFSDSDKMFAINIGIKYKSPEHFFVRKNKQDIVYDYNIDIPKHKEVVIMVGYPGSGKSTLVNRVFKENNYFVISGDVYKTSSKMIKVANDNIDNNMSIVFDATNSNKKKRAEYISFANKIKYPVRIIHMNTSIEQSYERNIMREENMIVPKIAYSVYNKYFEEPTSDEAPVIKID